MPFVFFMVYECVCIILSRKGVKITQPRRRSSAIDSFWDKGQICALPKGNLHNGTEIFGLYTKKSSKNRWARISFIKSHWDSRVIGHPRRHCYDSTATFLLSSIYKLYDFSNSNLICKQTVKMRQSLYSSDNTCN